MAIDYLTLENIVKQAFPDAVFILKDLVGDNDHYMLDIKDRSFANKTRIEQHKMVKTALKPYLSTTLHALTLKTDLL